MPLPLGVLRGHVGLTGLPTTQSSYLLHLVLLLVLGGLLMSASVEVLLNRARVTWLPGSAIATLLGVGVGAAIRATHGDDDLPRELGFSGTVFFLLILPVIMFEAGWSLRKKVGKPDGWGVHAA